MPDPRQQTAQRIARTEAYAQRLQKMFSQTVNDLLALPLTLKMPQMVDGQMYSFDVENAKVQEQVEQLLRRLQSAATMAVQQGIALEWEQANKAADTIIKSQFAKQALESPMMKGWNERNGEAMRQFIARSDKGMNLSDRIWQPCRQLRDEMEVALTVSIGEGQDAGTISRQIRHCLNDPDLMFRRFRYKDKDGRWQKKWKKRVKDPDHPGKYKFIDYDKEKYQDEWTGRGYYKSSAQNAMRVARTETNIAYRRADHERWQGMDFVLGQRVILSKSHPQEDICDKLSAPNLPEYDASDHRGVYPKDFVFDGWHPQCFCFVIPVMVSPEEMAKINEAFVNGEEYDPQGEQITEYPQEFKDWCRENEPKIRAAQRRGTEPYFVRNNAEAIEEIINPKKEETNTLSIQDIKSNYPHSHIDDSVSQEDFEKLTQGLNLHSLVSDVQSMASARGIDLSKFSIEVQDANEFVLKFSDGKETTELYRTFTRHNDGTITVNHDVFKIPKDKQSQGFSKEILCRFQKEYDRMGIARIDIQAGGDAGGYVWAKYGFMAKNRSQALAAVSDFDHPEWEQFVLDWYAKNGVDKKQPFPMRLIAEQTWGKDALTGKQWEGYIDLGNAAQRDIYFKKIGYNDGAIKDTSLGAKPLTIAERAKLRHDARTAEQIADIRERWQVSRIAAEQDKIDIFWKDEWNNIGKKAVGRTLEDKLRNYVDALEQLNKAGANIIADPVQRRAYSLQQIRQGLDAGIFKGSDIRQLTSLVKPRVEALANSIPNIRGLYAIKITDSASMPKEWRDDYLTAVKELRNNCDKYTASYYAGKSGPTEHAFLYAKNMAELASNELAKQYGLDKLSPKTPAPLFEEFFKRDKYLLPALPDKRFFDGLSKFVKLEVCSRGACCTNDYPPIVSISLEDRHVSSISGLKVVIYHEFGHAYDALSAEKMADRWRSSADLRKDYDAVKSVITSKWRKDAIAKLTKAEADARVSPLPKDDADAIRDEYLKKRHDVLERYIKGEISIRKLHKLQNDLDIERDKALGIYEPMKMLEEIEATLSDIVEAMDDKHDSLGYGGHGKSYWGRSANRDIAEFIAECSEARHIDFSVLEEAAPEIYALMLKYGKIYWP